MGIAFDTAIGAHLTNEQTAPGSDERATGMSLLNVASIKLGVDDWGKGAHAFGDGKEPVDFLWGGDGLGHYCGRDTGYTHILGGRLAEDLRADSGLHRLAHRLVLPGVEAVLQMEMNGIWVDMGRVAGSRAEFQSRLDGARAEVMAYIPEDFRPTADLDNDHFLRRWLFSPQPDGLGLPTISRTEKKGLAQVSDKVLRELAGMHPAPEALTRMRKAAKALTFFDQWEDYADPRDRLHPFFNLTGTVTGRRSCDSPNLQQVPKDPLIRACLGAPPGWVFLEVDYSQIEVRLAAILADEETMLRIFADPRGDIYRYTAARMLKKPEAEITKQERQKAKAVVLGFLYGMQARGFKVYAKDRYDAEFTIEESEQFRTAFFDAYPGLVRWHERQKFLVHKNQRVESPIGRVRHLWEIMSTSWDVMAKAERSAINSPVQGMGGDLILAGMTQLLAEQDRSRAMVVGDVHDALLFQLREDCWREEAKRILTVMEAPRIIVDGFDFRPPIRLKAEGKISTHWGEPDSPEFVVEDIDDVQFEPARAA